MPTAPKPEPQTTIPHSPYLPFDPAVALYNTAFEHLTPYVFSSVEQESLSWKKTCYLHAGLNPAMPYRVSGPDALRLFSDTCVNSFRTFAVGSTRHAVMCNAQGNVMSDGLLLRTGEDEFMTYFLSPYLNYFVDSGKYDVKGEDMAGQTFLFQLGGPRSLEVLEAAAQESLHDLPFFKHRPSRIVGPDGRKIAVRVLRVGVAGTLAYEVHGHIADALPVYAALLAAGEPFGLEPLGLQAYGMNHTENGFYQSFIHFMPAWEQDPDFLAYLGGEMDGALANVRGSAGPDPGKRYCTPLEADWRNRVVFDHEFIGRAALEKQYDHPARTLVTLVWHPKDVLDVYASQFRPEPPYAPMELPANPIWTTQNSAVYSDDVYLNGQLVGISSGRIYTPYSRSMLSLALLNIGHSAIGTEVEVLWGEPGTRQKTIRARVARFPFLDLPRNKDIDVRTIPAAFS